MSTVSFDTHSVANALESAGFTKAQVEALVEITRRTTQLPDVSVLATKDDVALLKSDLSVLKADLKADMAADKVQIIGILASLMTILSIGGALLGRMIH